MIDTDRGRKVKLDTARSSGGKEPELRGLREKEKKRRNDHPRVFLLHVCVCMYTNGTVFVVVTNNRPTAGVRHISLTRTLASLFSNSQQMFR